MRLFLANDRNDPDKLSPAATADADRLKVGADLNAAARRRWVGTRSVLRRRPRSDGTGYGGPGLKP